MELFVRFVAVISALMWCGAAVDDEFVGETRTVCIRLGCLEGTTQPGYLTPAYEAFLGIPYAEPPIGVLRFANPEAIGRWDGVYDAKQEKPNCVQKNYLIPNPTVEGEEDCLYLNVYRPLNASKSTDSLPVMVYIHGGGFFAGSPSAQFLGPQHFMDNGNVILVLMAYRLGALGFLSTGDYNSPGNFGLKDQVMAMKWVKEYIREFGGDSNSVTIFGSSAGGASVHMHMMSPLSAGLFDRAIAMSGLGTSPFNNPTKKPLALAREQAGLVGIKKARNMTSAELVARLREVDVYTLVDSGDGLHFWSIDPMTVYRTVVEEEGDGAFLSKHPSIIWKDGSFEHKPWMTGVVPNEGVVRSGAILSNDVLLAEFNNEFDRLVPEIMELNIRDPKHVAQINQGLRDFYLNGSKTVTWENRQGFMDMFTDRAFYHPLYKAVEAYLQYADTKYNPVYLYRFSYKGPASYSMVYTGTPNDFGVSHLDDLIYMFQTPVIFPAFPKHSPYAALTKDLVDTFVNFAKYGKPLIWDETRHCDKDHQGDFCDYQEFRNSAKDNLRHEIRTDDSFNTKMVEFWDDLLVL